MEPAHQGRGIGGRLMERVMAYLRAHAVRGAVVGLMAAAGKEGFYERYGFTRRPTDRLEAGMTVFWRVEWVGGAVWPTTHLAMLRRDGSTTLLDIDPDCRTSTFGIICGKLG